MKKINKIITVLSVITLIAFSISCSDEDMSGSGPDGIEGMPLNVHVGFGGQTRVSELPNLEAINDAGTNGLNHIGLYVYYTSDYNDGDGNLTMPYIRNLECRVEDGKLVPILDSSAGETDANIYIYDYMTLVAFYPYNADMSLEENWFTVRADEENYPITRSDYSEQTYIPYRGVTTANPTTAFYIEITLYPKHTFRMEIILVSENEADFNDTNPDIKVLPAIDPVDNDDPAIDGKREAWYDQRIVQPNTGGGMHVRRYIAYIWQDEEMDHVIQQNEVLYENGDFTLLATEEIRPREQRAYRYGYNFTTGESFIPTSSNLINDAASLQAFNGRNTAVYQVCDIDLNNVAFTPITMINSTYDGGGHKISNLNINSTGDEVGLFSTILGNSNLKNVNLIDPVITVNSSADTCYVGGLCGQVNDLLSDEELEQLFASINLPENLSEVVRQALIAEILAGLFNSQSQIIACRVENPVITVNGTYPRVGTIAGMNGDKSDNDSYRGTIWDTYSLGGSITVNAGNPAANEGARVGGFCGLNEFFTGRSYTTIEEANISAIQNVQTGVDEAGNPIIEEQNIFQGFTYQGTLFTTAEGAGIDQCYAIAPDSNAGVSQMPGSTPPGSWVQYSGIWPINTSTWTSYGGNSFWYQVQSAAKGYPILQWERR